MEKSNEKINNNIEDNGKENIVKNTKKKLRFKKQLSEIMKNEILNSKTNDIDLENNATVNNNNSTNEHEYILKIVNLKYRSTNKLFKKYNDYSSKIFESIKNHNIEKYVLPAKEIDCLVLGGGLKGYYVFGSLLLLKKMIDSGKIKVRKFIGISAGAFLSVFLFSNLDPQIIRNLNDFAIKNNSHYAIDHIMLKACWELLPENIHELINGKITILVSKGPLLNNKEKYIDHFESKLHLLQVLHASSFIPFITSKNYSGVSIKGEKYFDGAFSNYNPTNYSNDIPQLVFHTSQVNYSLSNTINFKDQMPELIILKGLLEFEKFIINHLKNKTYKNDEYPIKWIDPNIKDENTNLPDKTDKLSNKIDNKTIDNNLIITKTKNTESNTININKNDLFNNIQIPEKINNYAVKILVTMFNIINNNQNILNDEN